MGRRALQTQQRALDVTGHNISNANTAGYSRQEAVLKTTDPYTVQGLNKPGSPGQVGTGVDIQEIKRARDLFLDAQVRTENKSLGYWDVKKDALNKIEVIINEPSDSGLRTVLDQFWESWQELSKNPQSVSVRSVVRQRGIAVAETFNHLDRQYQDLQKDLNETVKIKVDDINSIAQQIADINRQVINTEINGDHANDLKDKRDQLIDQLSKIVNINVQESGTGAISVQINGVNLFTSSGNKVADTLAVNLNVVTGVYDMEWQAASLPLNYIDLQGGELKGLLEARGYGTPPLGTPPLTGIIPGMRSDLDLLASRLLTELNLVHSGGYGLDGSTGNNFFSGTDAADIAIDPVISGSLDAIAASNEAPLAGPIPVVGNGGNAIDIAQIKQNSYLIVAGFTGTIDDYYRSQTGKLGVLSQEAGRMVDNQTLLLDQLDQRRQSYSGVSLDEEMANMLKFQHAYNAAAKIVNAFDEMLETIINRLGAGR
jgi:flagellar hook-associated protein 1 FlgK